MKTSHAFSGAAAGGIVAGVLLLAMLGCKREERGFRVTTPAAATSMSAGVRLTAFQPGSASATPTVTNDYELNAHALAEGQRLFSAFNCVGCHAHGGGAIGPALMDESWRYGSEPQQIYGSIMNGRPNGMPAFRGKLPEQHAWKLAAYVRSLSGLVPIDAAPSRSDAMKTSPPPNSVDPVKRVRREPAPMPR